MTALATLYTALFAVLQAVGEVYADYAPANINRPYTVFFFVSGGNTRSIVNNRQMVAITVKAVADNLTEAQSLASAFNAILENAGLQDGGAIVGDADWDICTITQNGDVYQIEYDEQIAPIYHVGFEYEIVMEEK